MRLVNCISKHAIILPLVAEASGERASQTTSPIWAVNSLN
jgi:hypothetical protein